MRDTVRLGRIWGIPIGVNWSILAVAAYLVLSLAFVGFARFFPDADLTSRLLVAGATTLAFFLSILGHELGHAVVARRHGVGVDGITLWLLGGLARLTRQAPTPRAEFQIAAAGPFVNVVLGGVFAAMAYGIDAFADAPLLAGAASWLVVVNLLVALSNMIPAAPLDGGRVLTAYLWWRNGRAEHSRVLAARSGLVAGSVVAAAFMLAPLVFAAVDLWWALIGVATGLFLARAAIGEIAGAVVRDRLDGAASATVMTTHPSPVLDSLPVNQFLAWARSTDPSAACPVVRWDFEPVGYVAAPALVSMPPPDQSWTTVAEVMVPAPVVTRGWTTEPVSTILRRLGETGSPLAVLHDPATRRAVGTMTTAQAEPLFEPPTLWGSDRVDSTPPPV